MKIILDTNIYRNLIKDKTSEEIEIIQEKIIAAAKAQSITITFPIIPAMELINHYNDTHPVIKDECRKGLNLLVNLSTDKTKNNLHVKFTPPMDVILGSYLFGKEEDFLKIYAQAITLAQKLAGNLDITPEDSINDAIKTVSEQLDFEKEMIRQNYESYLKSINEGNVDWAYFQGKGRKEIRRKFFDGLRKGELSFLVAQSLLDRAYFNAKETYQKDEEFFRKVIQFMKDFCPALVMNELLLDNIGSGVVAISDLMDKRWNTILDISLIFGTLYNPQNDDIILVTEDQNIIDSFDKCGFNGKAIKLDDFLALLDIEQ
ncbi:hypothetical protein NG800_010955 [Epilithonimonas ginsengisoli]|uniref:PIN domain-containing protein n=1 Tax=Epilithonimonas ginsengisoli TaxID=1245592 RepID=A0ABU4JIC1_9FLAO|nr:MULTISPECIES: hypothetical protein [Chryseobacterium group]MBV6878829.1 hypothetical protein [Epilithonimonas sp. FP105]MDW8549432.1 hypothetical protein [Epilithonimonas ginsengisoli]OAH71686.1 hypothetical protein AXA65_12000 [Chryseobacterium sp. FP211-J200]